MKYAMNSLNNERFLFKPNVIHGRTLGSVVRALFSCCKYCADLYIDCVHSLKHWTLRLNAVPNPSGS